MHRKDRNIVLVGLMGAGKTTIGRALARRLSYPFFDSDYEIEKHAGISILNIFDLEGEQAFRLRERKMIADLVQKKPIVLATGGGSILNEENRTILRESGVVVYLHAAPHDLWLRTCKDKKRPLLHTPNPLETLHYLYQQRHELYRQCADIQLETLQLPIMASVGNILSQIKRFQSELSNEHRKS